VIRQQEAKLVLAFSNCSLLQNKAYYSVKMKTRRDVQLV